MMNEQYQDRKLLRLKRFDYSSNAAYFITICVKEKKHLLGNIVGYDACDVPYTRVNRYGKIIERYLRLMDNKYYNVFIDKYVVMPNHVHFILVVSNTVAEDYHESIRVGFYGTSQASYPTQNVSEKTILSASGTRQHEIVPKFVSLFKRYVNHDIGHNIWQRGYYDHIIRNEHDYKNIWNYIDNNPAHWAEDEYFFD